jgi:hypothetical protein
MLAPLKTVLFLAALLCSLAPASAVVPPPRVPLVLRNYALTVKGECYSVAGGKLTLLRSYQKTGRLQVRPRLATPTAPTNGLNVRDVAFFVNNGTNGGTGSAQLVTNASLASLFSSTQVPSFDVAFVSQNAAKTMLTITADKNLAGAIGTNLFKTSDGLLSEIYAVTGMTSHITFLAGGRVSGDYTVTGRGYITGAAGVMTARFSGVSATTFLP